MRLTKDREKELRALGAELSKLGSHWHKELFKEIDALRAELDIARQLNKALFLDAEKNFHGLSYTNGKWLLRESGN